MEAKTFDELCLNLSQPCECSGRWKLHSTKQVSCLYHEFIQIETVLSWVYVYAILVGRSCRTGTVPVL